MLRLVANLVLAFLPASRCFALKSRLLRYAGMQLGDGVSVNGHTWFYGRGKVNIGENTWIGPRCRFYTDASVTISIGKNCDIAPEVAFMTGSHEVGNSDRRAGRGYCTSIVVEDGCWVGTRVTILGGVTIGKGSVIGAGALVNKDVPPNCVVAGVPARKIKTLDAV